MEEKEIEEVKQDTLIENVLNSGITKKNKLGMNEVESLFWSDIINKLNIISDFKEFFIAVRKMTLKMTIHDLNIFSRVLDVFIPKYGSSAIVYLTDTIDADFVLKERNETDYVEIKMRNEIIHNFSKIFPYYTFIAKEYSVPTIGKIDIIAKFKEQYVIIEVKSKNQTPNTQLFAYSSAFINPILIGINGKPLSDSQKNENIKYYTFDELKNKVIENKEIWKE